MPITLVGAHSELPAEVSPTAVLFRDSYARRCSRKLGRHGLCALTKRV